MVLVNWGCFLAILDVTDEKVCLLLDSLVFSFALQQCVITAYVSIISRAD